MRDTEVNYLLVWIAVQGLSPDQALAALEMEYSEEAETRDVIGWPDLERRDHNNILMLDDRIFLGWLPQDWLLLFGNLDEHDKARLARLARFGPAFAGEISRIGNFAEGRAYASGQETWSVDYDLESRGRDDILEVEGSVPPHLAAIIGDAHAIVATGAGRDAGIDILFEVPGQLSKAICGFSPHEAPPEGFRWSMLQRIGGEPAPTPDRPGFFARLFGRG